MYKTTMILAIMFLFTNCSSKQATNKMYKKESIQDSFKELDKEIQKY